MPENEEINENGETISTNIAALPILDMPFNLDPFRDLWESRGTCYRFTDSIIKDESEDGEVTLYEGGAKVLKTAAVYIKKIGYFLKNDKRIYKDYISNEPIIIDKLYKRHYGNYIAIITKLNDVGILDLSSVEFTVQITEVATSLPRLSPQISAECVTINDMIIDLYIYIKEELLLNENFYNNYAENFKTGCFQLKSSIKATDLKKYRKHLYRKHKIDKLNNFNHYMENKPKLYSAMWGKKYTYGVEIETSSGMIPERFDKDIFYSAVHDGSLKDEAGDIFGGEYVTDVLYGDLGLLQLRKLSNVLSKYCMINKLCGVHNHIGNVDFNKENIILMYHLYQNIEDQIFSMLPKSRSNNEYCRKLTPLTFNIENLQGSEREYYLDYYYNDIINLLSQKDFCNDRINKKEDHPKGHKCGYDHSAYRYCWVNFIPAVFNTRKNGIYTIEFRPMSATTSYTKIKNWLFICIALVDIVQNHKQELYRDFSMNLERIIEIVYPKNHAKLNNYIAKRRAKFADISNSPEEIEATDYVDNEIENNLSIKNL